MDQIKIGRFIAKERKNKDYTQKQLADILGISDKTISKWEREMDSQRFHYYFPYVRN